MSQVTSTPTQETNIGSLAQQLIQFDGPPEAFLQGLLLYQCRVAGADAGAFLREGGDNRVDVMAVHPGMEKGATAPVWLAQSVEVFGRVVNAAAPAILPVRPPGQFYGVPAGQYLVLMPLRTASGARGVGAYMILSADQAVIARSREKLELTASLLALFEMRVALSRRNVDLQRLQKSMELLAAVNEHDHLVASGLSFCNQLVTRFGCERASLGFLRGSYVRLAAVSHTEKISRRSKLVQDIENTMEECLDQDLEVTHPATTEAAFVNRAAGIMAQQHGPITVLSLPLRKGGDPLGVLTVERAIDKPFSLEEVETLRLVCDLCATRLIELDEDSRWIGAKVLDASKDGLAMLVGPRHVLAKAISLAVLLTILGLIFIKGPDRVEAPFTLETRELRSVPAAFDGLIETVEPGIEPGVQVKAGQVLAHLDARTLLDQLAVSEAEYHEYQLQADAAISNASQSNSRDGKTTEQYVAEQHVAMAQRDRAAAEGRLLQTQIAQSVIKAPIDGVVLKGDLRRHIGAPVKTGDELFQIAPLATLRAVLMVPEDRIGDLRSGAGGAGGEIKGELAPASSPSVHIPFVVEQINPVAEVSGGRNAFRVRVRLDGDQALEGGKEWFRPGVEGLAKVDVGRKSYLQLWTRELVNWVRMKLWM